jgi:xylulose-5-phosphate/fructose-6-phosphate phosphoketolase
MAFHGYPNAVHGLLHGQADTDRFHVHGYREQGTTTTPFDMVVLNEMSRFHLADDAVQRATRRPAGAAALLEYCDEMLARHHDWIRLHLEDLPEVTDWVWRD